MGSRPQRELAAAHRLHRILGFYRGAPGITFLRLRRSKVRVELANARRYGATAGTGGGEVQLCVMFCASW